MTLAGIVLILDKKSIFRKVFYMALPFLNKKKVAAVIVKQRDGEAGGFNEQNEAAAENDMSSEDMGGGLEMAAADIIDAIRNGDAKGLAAALRAAMDICDAEKEDEEELG